MSKEQDELIKEIVTDLQSALLTAGFNPGKIDGDLGGITYKAYQNYKKAGILKAKKINTIPPIPTRAPEKIAGSWRVAKSLVQLEAQVNAVAPDRNKDADGDIGDTAHKARTSDHNAWIEEPTGPDVVSALDITHDPDSGVDCNIIAEAIKLDPRVKYIIWNKKIWSPEKGLKWRNYTGANPHTVHMHVSVKSDKVHYDDTKPWRLK